MSKITEEKFLEIFEGLKSNKDAFYFYRKELYDKEGFHFSKNFINWEMVFSTRFTKGFSSEWKSFDIIQLDTSKGTEEKTFVYAKLSRKVKRAFRAFLDGEYEKLRAKERKIEEETRNELLEEFIGSLTSNN